MEREYLEQENDSWLRSRAVSMKTGANTKVRGTKLHWFLPHMIIYIVIRFTFRLEMWLLVKIYKRKLL